MSSLLNGLYRTLRAALARLSECDAKVSEAAAAESYLRRKYNDLSETMGQLIIGLRHTVLGQYVDILSQGAALMPLATSAPDLSHRAVAPPDLVWRLNVEQYHGMIEAGILTEDDPVELLAGCLVPKMPKNPRHTLTNGLIHEAIVRLLPKGWFADSQEPVTTEDSEPEPDVRVVRGERRAYAERHPGPRDLGLVVEVSDATLERDRKLKKQLYGQSLIPVYWIVDLRHRRLEVYTEPSGPVDVPGYGSRQELVAGEEVPLVLDGVEVGRIAVSDILP